MDVQPPDQRYGINLTGLVGLGGDDLPRAVPVAINIKPLAGFLGKKIMIFYVRWLKPTAMKRWSH